MVKVKNDNPGNIRIIDLEFSVRTTNCLRNAGVVTVSDLASLSEKDLMAISNFGRRCLREVREVLGTLDIALREGPILTLEEQMQSALSRSRAARHAYENAINDVQRIAKLMASGGLAGLSLLRGSEG